MFVSRSLKKGLAKNSQPELSPPPCYCTTFSRVCLDTLHFCHTHTHTHTLFILVTHTHSHTHTTCITAHTCSYPQNTHTYCMHGIQTLYSVVDLSWLLDNSNHKLPWTYLNKTQFNLNTSVAKQSCLICTIFTQLIL